MNRAKSLRALALALALLGVVYTCNAAAAQDK